MIAVIARKEARDMLRDRRARGAALAIIAATIVTAVAGWLRHRRFEDEQAAHEARSRTAWETQGARDPHAAAHFGMYVFEPHGALATIDPGLTPYLGRAVWLEAHNQNTMKYRPAEDEPAIAAFRHLDVATLLQCIVPLFIVVLAYGAFAGERDRGTLRQLLVTDVTPRELVVGKALGVGLVLTIVTAPVVLLGAASVIASGGGAESIARFGLLAMVYALYFYTVLALTLAVSARAAQGRTALVVMLVGWLVVTVLVPRLAADYAELRAPTPSAAAFWSAIDADMKRDGGSEARLADLEKRLLDEYRVSRREDLPVSFDGLALQDGEEHHNAIYDVHYGGLFDVYAAQQAIHGVFGVVAPLISVQHASMALAETGLASHRAFAMQAEAYRRDVQRLLNGFIASNAGHDEGWVIADGSLWRSVPAFRLERPSLRVIIAECTPSLAVVAGWSVVATALLIASVRRLSP